MAKRKSNTILIASDHNGNDARSYLVENLVKMEYDPVDMGPARLDEKVDYTLYAANLCNAIHMNSSLRGILICGTGIGMSIAANRWTHVRASLVHDLDEAKKTREHNDSNVIVFGSWRSSKEEMLEMTSVWLSEEFGKGRHEARVVDITEKRDTIVAVPGVFDIVHPGHIRLFQFAKKLGRVVVLLNSDSSVPVSKGRNSWFDFEWRKNVLSGVDSIDEIIKLDGSAGQLAKKIGATVFLKGDVGLSEEQIRSIDEVPEGCEVKLFPLIMEFSSKKIREKR